MNYHGNKGDQRQRNGGGHGHRGGGKHNAGGSLQELTSAYNWVPLADWVYFPEWADQVSHDRPFRDGISGTLDLTIEAHTPILVADEKGSGNLRQFMRDPSGNYVIPGTGLRGMIRNVLEIASFGKFQRLDDQSMSYRDLQNQEYKRQIVGKVKTGWLRFNGEGFEITPCKHDRVDYNFLRNYTRGVVDFEGETESISAPEKYRRLDACVKRLIKKRNQDNELECWYIVLTGHPGATKKKDFLFEFFKDCERAPLNVVDDVMATFREIHADSPAWANLWRPVLEENGGPIPVFYICSAQNKVKALGLSQMFRLPYEHKLHDAVRHSSKEHLREDKMDLSECLFGRISNTAVNDSVPSLRGRVSFDSALAKHSQEDKEYTTILGAPKPSFYPSYIEQPSGSQQTGKLSNPPFNTLASHNVKLRGWKRYPVRNNANPPKPEGKASENDDVQSRLLPLQAGARFTTTMRVHNLRPAELGALLWCLDFGGNDNLRHALGMGRAFGFGQISIRVGASALRTNDQDASVDLAACRRCFEALMEATCDSHKGGLSWRETPQLRELLAMSDPAQAVGKNLRAPTFNENRNDFELAKGSGGNPKLVLRDYTAIEPAKRSGGGNR